MALICTDSSFYVVQAKCLLISTNYFFKCQISFVTKTNWNTANYFMLWKVIVVSCFLLSSSEALKPAGKVSILQNDLCLCPNEPPKHELLQTSFRWIQMQINRWLCLHPDTFVMKPTHRALVLNEYSLLGSSLKRKDWHSFDYKTAPSC